MIAERTETDYRISRPASPVGLRSADRFEVALPIPPPRLPLRHSELTPAARPMAHRGPRVVRRVRTFAWRSPMALAVLVASFCVTLAAFYVSAYARVAAAGVEEAHLARDIRGADDEKEALLARISELSLASGVQRTADRLSMAANDSHSEQLLSAPNVAPVVSITEATSRHSSALASKIVR